MKYMSLRLVTAAVAHQQMSTVQISSFAVCSYPGVVVIDGTKFSFELCVYDDYKKKKKFNKTK